MKIYVRIEGSFADVYCLTRQNWGAGKIYRSGSPTPEPSALPPRIFLRKERKGGEEIEYFYPLDTGLCAIRSTLRVGESVEVITKILGRPEGGGKSFEKREGFTIPSETGWYEI